MTPNTASETISGSGYKAKRRVRTARRVRSFTVPVKFECGMCAGRFYSERALAFHIGQYHAPEPANPYRVYDGDDDAA